MKKKLILSLVACVALSTSISADFWLGVPIDSAWAEVLAEETTDTTETSWSQGGGAVVYDDAVAHFDENGMIVSEQVFTIQKSNGMFVPNDTQRSVTIVTVDAPPPPTIPGTISGGDTISNDGVEYTYDTATGTYVDSWGDEYQPTNGDSFGGYTDSGDDSPLGDLFG